MTIPELKKEFTDTLNGLSRSHHPSKIFGDWLEITACALHQIPYEHGDFSKDAEAYQTIEAMYMEAIRGYSAEDLNQMGHMMSLTLIAHKVAFGDFLGELAGENELLNQRNGQFFTPYSVSLLMAQLTLGDTQKILDEKGIITIADSAAGSGSTLITTAEALFNQGLDPRSCAQFDAVDISRNAFNMAYIQLTAMDLQAVVRHGNSLSMEMWEHRPTPQLRYFDQDMRRLHAIEQMKQLIVNPETFFSGDEAEDAASEVSDEASDTSLAAKEEGIPNAPIRTSLLESEAFTGDDQQASTDGEDSKLKADVVLPDPLQLDLFGNVNDG